MNIPAISGRDEPKNSVSAKVYAFLQSKEVGYEFTIGDISKSLGLVNHGAASGFIAGAVVKGMCERKEWVKPPDRRKMMVFRLVDPTMELTIKNATLGSSPGYANNHSSPARLSTRAAASVSDRLLELAAEIAALEQRVSQPVDLTGVPIDQLLAEIQRRVPDRKRKE